MKYWTTRISIASPPNTAAGALICADPVLANAKMELNEHVLTLIAKLKEDEARDAFAEFERWSRERDRKCNLAGKENVPLQELSPSEGCLADYFTRKLAEVAAAKGEPEAGVRTSSGFALPRCRRRRPVRRANFIRPIPVTIFSP